MKRAAIMVIIAMLGTAAWSMAQNKPAAQNAPTGQAAAATGKRPPQAKTQPEFDAYKAAAALTDPAAQEKAADGWVGVICQFSKEGKVTPHYVDIIPAQREFQTLLAAANLKLNAGLAKIEKAA